MQRADEAVERAVRSFAAAMISLATHELNNRLAVMRETVGLLEDLARAGKSAAAGTARAHGSLDDQVGRALNVVRTLGGLAGALGSGGGFDPGVAIGDLLDLTERWSRQRSLRIEREIAADLPRVDGDPAVFLCLVHRLLERCAGAGQPGGSIRVRVVRAGEGILLQLAPTGGAEGAAVPADDDETARELALRLGGGLKFEGGGGATILLAAAH